ncbi:bifunctional riboflavin kinase/FAD synthetase [soil metagenome]
MRVVRGAESFPRTAQGSAVTIGAYDGVHRGHRAVIAEVRRLAAERGLVTAAVTFDRHPASVVRPESAPRLLTDLEQKLELLATTGLDHTFVVSFDEVRSKESAEDFVTGVLAGSLGARLVVVGEDFHFGHQRRGNVALLRQMGLGLGFDVIGLGLVDAAGRVAAAESVRVSSTAIRAALVAGDLAAANEALGRHHEVRGVVVHGDHRGQGWGYPTANVAAPEEVLVPADGIYAGWYERPDGAVSPAAVSIGRRPTVHDHQDTSLLEAHLLDFDGELYGEVARVRFVARLRGEERYGSVEALITHIGRDCYDARRLLTCSF